MQLVIAEKPSVARDLARALSVPARGKTAFEGDRYVITWCIGHLVELEEPAAYDARWRAWRLDTLPMLPPELKLRAATHARPQLRAVTALLRERRFSSVINACDAGREGELIFRYLLHYANVRPAVQRLWVSSLTDEAIRKGFAALRPGAQLDALGDAARCRSEADWLVGLNATRAVTARAKAAGGSTLYSIGRVQTPTLAMLVAREQEIESFVPTPYWEVRAALVPERGPAFEATWRRAQGARLARAELADQVVARSTACGRADDAHGPRVERVVARTVKEPPPLLFDLTSLQRTANRRFGFSAAHTLELAQALYERHKLLTYPRTDSRHLPSALVPELPSLFAALTTVPELAPFARTLVEERPRPGRRVVDDARVSDHHAIIPTDKTSAAAIAALGRDERRLFDLVARRFLGAFFPDAELAVTEVWIAVGPGPVDERDLRAAAPSPRPASERAADAPVMLTALPAPPDVFFARGRTRVVAGWQEVAGIGDERARRPSDEADADDEADGQAALPRLERGQRLTGTFAARARHTTPPPRYTEATLLGAMESAGKAIDDEALREAMKERGLGTPATRAAIIETLLHRRYIERDRAHLVPTATGRSLIAALAVPSLCSPELTGEWEARLLRIARGQETRAAFMADIARYVTELVDAVRAAPPPAPGPDEQARPAPRRGRKLPRAGRRPRAGGRAAAPPRRARRQAADRHPDERAAAPSRTSPTSAPAATAASPTAPRRRSAAAKSAAGAKRSKAPKTARTSGPSGRAAPTRSTTDRERPASAAPPSSPMTFVAVPAALDLAARAALTQVARAVAHGRDADRSSESRTTRVAATAEVRAPAPSPQAGPSAPPPAASAALDLGCPRCGQGRLVTGQRGWGCSRWRDGCRFVIWFHTAGKDLSPAQLRDLVRTGKTRKATFHDSAGAPLAGRLVLDVHQDGGAARLVPA